MMLYPKKQQKKKQKQHNKTSILQGNEKCCYICGSTRNLQKHHIYFGGGMRDISEAHGFYVYLTVEWHEGTEGVHGRDGHALDQRLKRECQAAFERTHSHAEFMEIIGRNYIDLEDGALQGV